MIDWDPEFAFGFDEFDGDTDDDSDSGFDDQLDEDQTFDTYDRIVDEDELTDDKDDDFDLRPEHLGLAFAFAETVVDGEKSKQYEVDEDTDRENWDAVQRLVALDTRHRSRKELRPFDQLVDDICKGKRSFLDLGKD
jgi:hypothetical protein